jgi:uncharacterized protein (DUF736 family)
MAKIGAFSKTEHGYKGRVRTLTVNTEVEIISIDPSGDGAPQYRLYSAGSAGDAGWEKTSDAGRDYISLKFDDLALPAPFYASLFADDEGDIIKRRPRTSFQQFRRAITVDQRSPVCTPITPPTGSLFHAEHTIPCQDVRVRWHTTS